MRIISRKALADFYETHPDAKQPLLAWFREAKHADWTDPSGIKAQYGSASILKDKVVVFNIGGNKYRLVTRVLFETHLIYIRFVGTHADYDALSIEDL